MEQLSFFNDVKDVPDRNPKTGAASFMSADDDAASSLNEMMVPIEEVKQSATICKTRRWPHWLVKCFQFYNPWRFIVWQTFI